VLRRIYGPKREKEVIRGYGKYYIMKTSTIFTIHQILEYCNEEGLDAWDVHYA
jgi:hypothetical protein